MTMPSSTTECPGKLWPPPRTATGRLLLRANASAAWTSEVLAHRAMSAGRRSMSPFQTFRAASYSACSGVITSPIIDSLRSTSAALDGFVCGTIGLPRDDVQIFKGLYPLARATRNACDVATKKASMQR
jgi:hypothetical protein